MCGVAAGGEIWHMNCWVATTPIFFSSEYEYRADKFMSTEIFLN